MFALPRSNASAIPNMKRASVASLKKIPQRRRARCSASASNASFFNTSRAQPSFLESSALLFCASATVDWLIESCDDCCAELSKLSLLIFTFSFMRDARLCRPDILVWLPEYLAIFFNHRDRTQATGATWAAYAVPTRGLIHCAMRGTHQIQAARIEEFPFGPIQFDRHMCAAVQIGTYDTAVTHDKTRGITANCGNWKAHPFAT